MMSVMLVGVVLVDGVGVGVGVRGVGSVDVGEVGVVEGVDNK